MSDVIKFEFDRPVEVALRFTEPRIFPSQFAGADDRHMFSTVDGRVMYVTPLTSARIKALNLAEGEIFWICKRKNGRVTEFAVSREPMAAPPAPVVFGGHKKTYPPLKNNLPDDLYYTPPSATLEEQLRASIEMVERRKQVEAAGPVAVPPQPKAVERMAPAVAEFSARLVLETNALVDSYAEALRVASERHGNTVKPEDVRSLLVTAYINASKQGRAA